jgi:hypothetical protein
VSVGDLVYYTGLPHVAGRHKILGTIIATREGARHLNYYVKWFDYISQPLWYGEHEIIPAKKSSNKPLTLRATDAIL